MPECAGRTQVQTQLSARNELCYTSRKGKWRLPRLPSGWSACRGEKRPQMSRKDTDLKLTLNAALVGTILLLTPLFTLAQTAPNAPFAGAAKMTCAQALAKVAKDDPALGKLAKAFAEEGAKLKKAPKDAKAKKAYVAAGVMYEQKIVRLPNKLSSPVKYRAGLGLCRQVLAVDPKNPECRRDMDEIVGIYKNMGMAIPE